MEFPALPLKTWVHTETLFPVTQMTGYPHILSSLVGSVRLLGLKSQRQHLFALDTNVSVAVKNVTYMVCKLGSVVAVM